MTASVSGLTLQVGGENELNLTLQRKVMMIQNVVMDNIPSDVEELSVTISPIYTTLLLDGSYGDETGSATISLTKDGETSSWKSTSSVYFLASKGVPSITVNMKRTDDTATKSYTYTMTEAFVANYKYDITGTYEGDKVTVSGTLTGVTWDGAKEITFTYGENNESSDGNGSGSTAETGTVPAVGSLYNGCYVFSVDESTSPIQVTLMSLKEYNTWTFNEGNVEELEADIEYGLTKLAVDGVSGWRLPTETEIIQAYNTATDINTNLAAIAAADSSVDYDAFYTTTSHCHLYESNSLIYCYYSASASIEAEKIGRASSTLLRAFATVSFASE